VEGVLWLASVRDAFSNKVVGWDSGPCATTELVISALDYAIWSRDVRDGRLIHHSDTEYQRAGVPGRVLTLTAIDAVRIPVPGFHDGLVDPTHANTQRTGARDTHPDDGRAAGPVMCWHYTSATTGYA
jgi:hypothetical protein